MRFGAYFVGLCMALIAGSLGVAAYLGAGFSGLESIAVILTALSAMAAANAFAGRSSERANLSQQLADLSRGTTELARQVGELGRRVVAVETAMGQIGERTRAATEPLSAEIEVLGTLMKQVAESVAAHELALLNPFAVAAPAPVPEPPRPTSAPAQNYAAPPMPRAAPIPGESAEETHRNILREIRAALSGNRLDLHLQPIVTLPQRKVRFYEAMSRLRTEDGAVLMPAEYLSPAESGGLMPMLDNLMLFRSVQIMRRLTSRNREVGLFCNIAGSTLTDGEFFPQLLEFLTTNKALCSALIFEFPQKTYRTLGPVEHESLAQLQSLGFRFSIDHVTDLQIEPRQLADQGFRYVKAPASLLLSGRASVAPDIHVSDFADLLRRYGIELIAEKIESETAVVDLLDFEVRYAQGYLFAPPRPARNEALAPKNPVATGSYPLPPAPPLEKPDPEAVTLSPPSVEAVGSSLARLAKAFARNTGTG